MTVFGLVKGDSCCVNCSKAATKARKASKRKSNMLTEPAKSNATISLTSPQQIKLTLQKYRVENKQLKGEIQKLQDEIATSAVPITTDLCNDLVSIMSNADNSKTQTLARL